MMDNRLSAISDWNDFVDVCNTCTACDLAAYRTNAVVWRGSLSAPIAIIGEGPGANEDLEGLPFVGRSGRLLDQCLEQVGLVKEDYHILNMVKCRPPENRKPTVAECAACRPLLDWQLAAVQPNVIVLLGATAYNYFTGDKRAISKVRGEWMQFGSYLIMPTFHPAYVLRDPRQKDKFLADLSKVREKLGELEL